MSDFLDRWAESSAANTRLVAQETLILETTEALWALLASDAVTKSALAERMGTTKGYVSQVLSGSRNMTLRTLSDLCFALNAKPQITIQREEQEWTTAEELPISLDRRPKLRLVVDNDPSGYDLTALKVA